MLQRQHDVLAVDSCTSTAHKSRTHKDCLFVCTYDYDLNLSRLQVTIP